MTLLEFIAATRELWLALLHTRLEYVLAAPVLLWMMHWLSD